MLKNLCRRRRWVSNPLQGVKPLDSHTDFKNAIMPLTIKRTSMQASTITLCEVVYFLLTAEHRLLHIICSFVSEEHCEAFEKVR
jgi:hypothetical protein